MNTLGGNVCIRNGEELDYCWREAVQSLLDLGCDKVLITDCMSTDGTREAMHEWAAREDRLMLGEYPWTDPRATNTWWPDFLNFGREHLPTTHHIQLDADEVLDDSHESFRAIWEAVTHDRVLMCKRWNFWRDAQSLIPEGHCCGTKVIRVAPQKLWMPSDYPDPRGADISGRAAESCVEIFHYGFLRRHDAFFKKARAVQRIWADSYDPRLADAEKNGANWASTPGVTGWENNLVPFTGKHPEIALPWLRDRGYTA